MSRGEGGCEGLYFLPAPFINFSTSVSEAGHSLKDVGLICGLNTQAASDAPRSAWSLGLKGKSLMDSFQVHKQLAGPNKACYKEELLHVLLAVNLA